jgi:hypothetical protein
LGPEAGLQQLSPLAIGPGFPQVLFRSGRQHSHVGHWASDVHGIGCVVVVVAPLPVAVVVAPLPVVVVVVVVLVVGVGETAEPQQTTIPVSRHTRWQHSVTLCLQSRFARRRHLRILLGGHWDRRGSL